MYFLYPETSGVRLEDMDALFGDATTAMPTPATPAERGSLMGVGSPVPSLDIRRSQEPHLGADYAIPGLDIYPPTSSHQDKPIKNSDEEAARSEGIGGWISNLVRRGKDQRRAESQSQYRRLDQGDDE